MVSLIGGVIKYAGEPIFGPKRNQAPPFYCREFRQLKRVLRKLARIPSVGIKRLRICVNQLAVNVYHYRSELLSDKFHSRDVRVSADDRHIRPNAT